MIRTQFIWLRDPPGGQVGLSVDGDVPPGRPFWTQKSGRKIAKIEPKNPDKTSFMKWANLFLSSFMFTRQVLTANCDRIESDPPLRYFTSWFVVQIVEKASKILGRVKFLRKSIQKSGLWRQKTDPKSRHVPVHLSSGVPPLGTNNSQFKVIGAYKKAGILGMSVMNFLFQCSYCLPIWR